MATDEPQHPKGSPRHAAQVAARTLEYEPHAAGSTEPYTEEVTIEGLHAGDIIVRHEMWGRVRVIRMPDDV